MKEKPKKGFLYFLKITAGVAGAGFLSYISYKVGFANGAEQTISSEENTRLRVENQIRRRENAMLKNKLISVAKGKR